MITDNKKLIKEINTIIASSAKAMELTRQEIEKVDAKYRALAEKEKADLEKLLKMQEGQISAYKAMVGITDEPAPEPEQPESAEGKVTDTIFPENNEPEDAVEETPEAKEQKQESEPEQAEEPDWGDADESATAVNDDDDWPEEPEEWK